MRFHHHFTVNTPLDAVVRFHRSAESLRAISPPWIPISALEADDPLEDGDIIAFTLWLGPIPVRWIARIENNGESGFIDRLMAGPFASWEHNHEFTPIDSDRTRIDDHVVYHLKSNRFWRLIGGLMALGLPVLFRHRAAKTAFLLEDGSASTIPRSNIDSSASDNGGREAAKPMDVLHKGERDR